MVHFTYRSSYDFNDLQNILRILRAPDGCPWDRVQTHESNRRNFLEEAYEAAEAFDRDDPVMMCEELGDVLMQVLFNVHMEEDAGRFTFADVTDRICKKLIFRHPHVFGTADAPTPEAVSVSWEELKRKEKSLSSPSDELAHVAKSLPALWRAEKLQKKAAAVGFDYKDADGALTKLREETEELANAAHGDGDVAEELGDVLFAAVKAGRFFGLDPETTLHATCEKFISRFRIMESCAGASLSDCSETELSRLWEEAKHIQHQKTNDLVKKTGGQFYEQV